MIQILYIKVFEVQNFKQEAIATNGKGFAANGFTLQMVHMVRNTTSKEENPLDIKTL